MVPESLHQRSAVPDNPSGDTPRPVCEECLVIRNYDGRRSHRVTVRFVDATDEPAFRGTHSLAPLGVVSVSERIDRAVYRVEVEVDGETTARRECLIGSGPGETALVEVGNGLVSISEEVA